MKTCKEEEAGAEKKRFSWTVRGLGWRRSRLQRDSKGKKGRKADEEGEEEAGNE